MRAGAAALAALALAVGAPAAAAADPAPAALDDADVYVSTAALGARAPEAVAALEQTARRLRDAGTPARLAIVQGPAGAPSMRVYARRLARELSEGETLVVTAPGRPVIAVGPRAPADITRRLRAERIGAVDDPVERVARAAALAVPEPLDEEAWGTRAVLVMLGLAALGAAWAVAWGARRRAGAEREVVLEARAAAAVRLDAASARAAALAGRDDLPAAARADLQRAIDARDAAAAALQGARSPADVDGASERIAHALADLSRAAASVGEDQPADDPFAGLCGADPAHGPAVGEGPLEGLDGPAPLCADCAARAADGAPPRPRLVPVAGRPAVFSATASSDASAR